MYHWVFAKSNVLKHHLDTNAILTPFEGCSC